MATTLRLGFAAMSLAPIRILTAAVMQYNAQHRSTCKPTVDSKQFWLYFLLEYCILLASQIHPVAGEAPSLESSFTLCTLSLTGRWYSAYLSSKQQGMGMLPWQVGDQTESRRPRTAVPCVVGTIKTLISSITVRRWNNYCTIKHASANTTIRKTQRVMLHFKPVYCQYWSK